MIDYFRPTTIHQRAYPPSKRPRPAKKFYTPKSKSASNSSANHICPTCECYRGTERYHDCPRDCLPFELPSHKPRPQPKDIIQCPYCRRYGIKGTRCSDGRQFWIVSTTYNRRSIAVWTPGSASALFDRYLFGRKGDLSWRRVVKAYLLSLSQPQWTPIFFPRHGVLFHVSIETHNGTQCRRMSMESPRDEVLMGLSVDNTQLYRISCIPMEDSSCVYRCETVATISARDITLTCEVGTYIV